MSDPRSVLYDPVLMPILFAVLVDKLGNNVPIVQADIDRVAYNRLEVDHEVDGSLMFRLVQRGQQ